jgi:radical SAM superfamily enzyme YgiQ (UPF0313 family)
MKVLFIHPPLYLADEFKGMSEWDKVVSRLHPLGIGYLAAYLEKRGHVCAIVDAHCEQLGIEEILARTKAFQPDIVGVAATSPAFKNAVAITTRIKAQAPSIVTVLGGAHVTAAPTNAMRHGVFDYGVTGEGEETLGELLDALVRPSPAVMRNIKGLVFRNDGQIAVNEARLFITDLDAIPLPARHLMVPLAKTQTVPASVYRLPSGNLITSRGCPSHCTFCDNRIFGRRVRTRSAVNIVDEIEALINVHGARDIKFYDDTFTVNKNRVHQIVDEMKRRKIRIPWSCLARVKDVNLDLLRYMRENGCWQILYGVESGDDRMLALLRKGNTVEDNRNAVTWAADVGMSIRGDFVLGTPGETRESLENTLAFALSVPLNYAHFNKFVPLPGTEIYRNLVAQGHAMDPETSEDILTNFFHVEFVPEGLDRSFYEDFLRRAHRQFYFRPRHLLRQAMALRTLDQFVVQMHGFKALLKV